MVPLCLAPNRVEELKEKQGSGIQLLCLGPSLPKFCIWDGGLVLHRMQTDN